MLNNSNKTAFYGIIEWWAQQGSNLRPKDYESDVNVCKIWLFVICVSKL